MSLLERNSDAPPAWIGGFPMQARYSAGVAGERFLRALQEKGQILGATCEQCDLTYVPARAFCERCLAELEDWTDMGTGGEVHTFTLLFENLDGTPREDPLIVAFVQIGDGGIVHLLEEIDPESVAIGMPVEAVLKPKAERQGSILDIAYFKPAS